MKIFRCDLHIHTCLSPCGDLDMHPQRIVAAALESGLDIIAITDHNASENVRHVQAAASGTALTVIAGMEVCSREEVHVVALLPDMEALARLQQAVYDSLAGENDEDAFGCQPEVNQRGEVEGFNPHLLIGATAITLPQLVALVHDLGGLAFAAHVDRPSFSVISQLGFVPEDAAFDALEISAAGAVPEGFPLIRSSDAHFVGEIGCCWTAMRLAAPTFAEIALALAGRDGRAVLDA